MNKQLITDIVSSRDLPVYCPYYAKRLGDETMAMENIGAVKSVDPSKFYADAILTTVQVDREGDVVEPAAIFLDNYKKNPVFLWAHDANAGPVGRAKDPQGNVTVRVYPDHVIGRCFFHNHSKIAEQTGAMVMDGFVNSVSIGFQPHEAERFSGRPAMKARPHNAMVPPGAPPVVGWRFKRIDLLEVSWCSLGMNPDAVATTLGKGIIAGSPIDPVIRKHLEPFAAPLREMATSGWQGSAVVTKAKRDAVGHMHGERGRFVAGGSSAADSGAPHGDPLPEASAPPSSADAHPNKAGLLAKVEEKLARMEARHEQMKARKLDDPEDAEEIRDTRRLLGVLQTVDDHAFWEKFSAPGWNSAEIAIQEALAYEEDSQPSTLQFPRPKAGKAPVTKAGPFPRPKPKTHAPPGKTGPAKPKPPQAKLKPAPAPAPTPTPAPQSQPTPPPPNTTPPPAATADPAVDPAAGRAEPETPDQPQAAKPSREQQPSARPGDDRAATDIQAAFVPRNDQFPDERKASAWVASHDLDASKPQYLDADPKTERPAGWLFEQFPHEELGDDGLEELADGVVGIVGTRNPDAAGASGSGGKPAWHEQADAKGHTRIAVTKEGDDKDGDDDTDPLHQNQGGDADGDDELDLDHITLDKDHEGGAEAMLEENYQGREQQPDQMGQPGQPGQPGQEQPVLPPSATHMHAVKELIESGLPLQENEPWKRMCHAMLCHMHKFANEHHNETDFGFHPDHAGYDWNKGDPMSNWGDTTGLAAGGKKPGEGDEDEERAAAPAGEGNEEEVAPVAEEEDGDGDGDSAATGGDEDEDGEEEFEPEAEADAGDDAGDDEEEAAPEDEAVTEDDGEDDGESLPEDDDAAAVADDDDDDDEEEASPIPPKKVPGKKKKCAVKATAAPVAKAIDPAVLEEFERLKKTFHKVTGKKF